MRPDDRPAKTDRYQTKDLVDELLLYDAETSRVHVLNSTVREIYLHCDGRRSVDDLVRGLLAEFEVDETTARRDTETTLERLVELGIVKL